MRALLLIPALAIALQAEDAKPVPDPQLVQLREENAKLLKLLNEYQQRYFTCEATLISQKVFTPPPKPKKESSR